MQSNFYTSCTERYHVTYLDKENDLYICLRFSICYINGNYRGIAIEFKAQQSGQSIVKFLPPPSRGEELLRSYC